MKKNIIFSYVKRIELPDVVCKNTGHFVNSNRSRLCPKCVIAPDSRIAFFEKNAFLTMRLSLCYFLFDFMKLP